MEDTWEDNYLVIYYMDGELNYRSFPNNPEAANFLQELADTDMDFDPYIHSMVVKTEAEKYAILTVTTQKITKVCVGGY